MHHPHYMHCHHCGSAIIISLLDKSNNFLTHVFVSPLFPLAETIICSQKITFPPPHPPTHRFRHHFLASVAVGLSHVIEFWLLKTILYILLLSTSARYDLAANIGLTHSHCFLLLLNHLLSECFPDHLL